MALHDALISAPGAANWRTAAQANASFLFLCCCSTTVFSHSQTVVVCPSCNTVLCVPTGGKARLTEGEWRRPGWGVAAAELCPLYITFTREGNWC